MTHELYKTKEEIESWLHKYKIINYELIKSIDYGYVVNANENVLLDNYMLKKIEVKFNIINGFFDCSLNSLNSLYGCPEVVNGRFNCSNNTILSSLKYCPKKISESFICSNNQIKNLIFSPKIINGDFDCADNKLKTLEGCPEIINGNFYCNNNNLESLKYFPEKIIGKSYLTYNSKIGEVQKLSIFEEIYAFHKSEINKNFKNTLDQEIVIDNNIKTAKIKV